MVARWAVAGGRANRDGEPQLFKIPVGGGTPVLLVNGVLDRSDLGAERTVSRLFRRGRRHELLGQGGERGRRAARLPKLILTRGARRLAFLGGTMRWSS